MNNKIRPIIFDTLKGYSKNDLVSDIVAGIIVAIIALPLSIALALASGVGPEQGIYTAIVAGFVIALLECLTGATYDEVVEDYMVTYVNYYGVEPGSEKYNAIAQSNIIKSLQAAFGVEDLSKAKLADEATEYIKSLGLTDKQIAQLKANLGVKDPSNPSTGDAGVIAYVVMGISSLLSMGAVTVLKKRR